MSITIAQIAAKALNAASKSITDSVALATLTSVAKGDYDVASGTYSEIITVQTGRAVFQGAAPIRDSFPDYVIGPADELILIEGMTGVKENDRISIADKIRTVRAVQDIGGAGTLFNVIAR